MTPRLRQDRTGYRRTCSRRREKTPMKPSLLALGTAVALALAPLPADAATTYHLVSTSRSPGMPASYYPHTAISGNGRYVAYHVVHNDASVMDLPVPCCHESIPKTVEELWLADLATKKQVKVLTGNCCINELSLSRDGRYLVFESYSTDVVPNDKNEARDVYVYDSKTRKTTRIVGNAGQELNKGAYAGVVSPDGKTVVYVTDSDVLNKRNQQAPPCSLYKYSIQTRKSVPVLVGGKPVCAFTGQIAVSSDARYLAIMAMDAYVREDASGQDVYWIDTVAQRAVLMSGTAVASQSGVNEQNDSPTIDGSGRYVAFVSGTFTPFSLRTDKTVLLRDVRSGALVDVSTGTMGAATPAVEDPRLSEDGKVLTFLEQHGDAPAASPFDLRTVWVRDLTKDIASTERLEPIGACADPDCTHPSSQNAVPSANGKVVAYITNSGHAQGDDDHAFDVYVARR